MKGLLHITNNGGLQLAELQGNHLGGTLLREQTAAALNAVRAAGGRIVCVGTTALRLIESASGEDGVVRPFADETAKAYQFTREAMDDGDNAPRALPSGHVFAASTLRAKRTRWPRFGDLLARRCISTSWPGSTRSTSASTCPPVALTPSSQIGRAHV